MNRQNEPWYQQAEPEELRPQKPKRKVEVKQLPDESDINLDLHGWYPVISKIEPAIEMTLYKTFIDKRFIYGVKRFNPKTLQITEYVRLQGSIFNSIKVRGIKNLDKTAEMLFFIKESNVKELRVIIGHYGISVVV